MQSILLLEDDMVLSRTLIKYLSIHGYSVDWAKDGEEAIDMSYESSYDLYLFDINVPLVNGIDLLGLLREAGDMTPAIIISALTDIQSVTKGFMAGADDYIKKPFDPEELLVRIKAKTSTLSDKLTHGDIEIDLQTKTVKKNGELISIGEVQRSILASLIKNCPNPVTKDELMLLLETPTDLALRVNISKLKKRLGVEIKSIRGVGYQII